MTPPVIETARLRLRGWQPGDLAPFAAVCADPQVMRFIGTGAVRSPTETARSIAAFQQGWAIHGYGLFAVEDRKTAIFLGFAGLSLPDFLPEVLPSVEIGWRLARPHWGKGYATEAARAVLDHAVRDLGLTDIVSIYQIGNHASERVMQKLGMVFDRQTMDPGCGRAVGVYRYAPGSA